MPGIAYIEHGRIRHEVTADGGTSCTQAALYNAVPGIAELPLCLQPRR